ncbi:MAG TPA: hypothetical protein VGO01_19765 [Bradyrhizobium sp.]|nr:hypothetical protein [Bradyrhizobium sp.]
MRAPTRGIVDIADPLGIVVHDHTIAGKNVHASLKGLKLIQPNSSATAHRWSIFT